MTYGHMTIISANLLWTKFLPAIFQNSTFMHNTPSNDIIAITNSDNGTLLSQPVNPGGGDADEDRAQFSYESDNGSISVKDSADMKPLPSQTAKVSGANQRQQSTSNEMLVNQSGLYPGDLVGKRIGHIHDIESISLLEYFNLDTEL